ncbi:putative WEB family protein At1g65010, chloroplastic isoform X1 [Amaranthus tricolor]|uniref:putative WEB family protein At1g65010, chloroplastic isoform X1 n=2 Tax=Amaranthus tricolor TaxID=29722 RepID=UPI00258D5635|nr:putative WEB family protein At1g65010, chloroplastic isoform X1 [Amaranthus tricolor]
MNLIRENFFSSQEMQQMSHENIMEELNEVKAQLGSTEREKNHALNEIKEIKSRISSFELDDLKKSLRNAETELRDKDMAIESLKSELDNLKQLELKLKEKDSLSDDSRKKVEELEDEIRKRKDSEATLSESFARQTSQIEESSILLKKLKLQISLLEEKMQKLVEESERKDKEAMEERERLMNEVSVLNKNASCATERRRSGSLETENLLDEIDILKNELKRAMESEVTSKKAMDELAVALKEVAAESNQAKEKLISTEQHLEAVKEEASILKKMVKSNEENYEALLKESKIENDRLKNTVNRLRLEAEESLLAFNDKEVQFVNCIKKTEEEKSIAHKKYTKMDASLKEAEEMSEKAKDENKKLRDILKQALNEANVAKEAANLAKTENSYLKDSLIEKDKALVTLAQETERLRINEAEANESIKELKRVISLGSKKEVARHEKENKEHKKEKENKDHKKERDSKELKKIAKKEIAAENTDKEHKEGRRLSNTFSFDLNHLWPSIPGMTCRSSKDFDADFEEDDVLGGSIFDVVDSPVKDIASFHQRTSSACSSEDNLNLDHFDEDAHYDDLEIDSHDRTSHGPRKALYRKFSDLLRRRSSHPPKDLPHPPKDVSHSPKEIPA